MERISNFIRHQIKKFPIESIAVTFVVGVLIGIVVGIVLNRGDNRNPIEDVACIASDVEQKGSDTNAKKNDTSVENYHLQSDVQSSDETGRVCADVSGAVMKPGVYCRESGGMIIDFVQMAGGVDSKNVAGKYTMQKINLSVLALPAQKIYLPYKQEVECSLLNLSYANDNRSSTDPIAPIIAGKTDSPDSNSKNDKDQTNGQTNSNTECVDINGDSLEKLSTLDGVGVATAQKIIDARPFGAVDELLNVSGIGDAKYKGIKDKICPI